MQTHHNPEEGFPEETLTLVRESLKTLTHLLLNSQLQNSNVPLNPSINSQPLPQEQLSSGCFPPAPSRETPAFDYIPRAIPTGFPSEGNTRKSQSVRPIIYDGSTPWAINERQFLMISELNGWSQAEKAATLTASLTGPALQSLSSLTDVDARDFQKICTTLKLRFGEEHMVKLYFTQFENRRQMRGEDLATLGHDLKRLARSALPDC